MDNKSLVRRYLEGVFSKHDLALIDETMSSDFVEYQNYDSSGEKPINREEWKKVSQMFLSAFPDLHCDIMDVIAEGDKVACRWISRGTHKGTYMGVAPTNKQVTIPGISIFRIVNGKIVEGRASWDMIGCLAQLGALPIQFKKAA